MGRLVGSLASRMSRASLARVASSFAVAVPFPLLACHSSDSGTIQIITDEEAGTFTNAPAPTELRIVAESGDAGVVLASARLPATSIDLGQQSESGPVVSIHVQGLDSKNISRVAGASLPLQFGALVGQTIPIFVQRDDEFANLPASAPDGRQFPLLATLQGQYLLVAGGSVGAVGAKATQLFDFGTFSTLDSPPTLPLSPQSMGLTGTVAWLIGASGAASFDFSDSGTAALSLPAGGTAADIAGGATVFDSNGAQYIVGATRATGPSGTTGATGATDKVLAIDSSGSASWITLSAKRLGAAAAWMPNYGLVIVGGSATAAGVEVVAASSMAGAPLAQFPPDPTAGAGAAPLDAQRLIVAGGVTGLFQDSGVRELDLGCDPSPSTPTGSCAPVTAKGSFPVALGSAQTFTWSASSEALVVGNEAITGATHVFHVTPGGIIGIPTRAPHVNARAAWSPLGSVVLFGGGPTLESFVP